MVFNDLYSACLSLLSQNPLAVSAARLDCVFLLGWYWLKAFAAALRLNCVLESRHVPAIRGWEDDCHMWNRDSWVSSRLLDRIDDETFGV